MKNHKSPRVSVIMSVYNGETFLHDAVMSILEQTYQHFEFLIMNDGSKDSTSEILETYTKHPNVRCYSQQNQGLTKSLNTLISFAKGEYIARMDADDISHRERLERQVDYLDYNPKCGITGVGSLNIDSVGRSISGYQLPDNHNFLLSQLEKGLSVYKHGSIMLRRSVLIKLATPYRFYYGQDFDLYLRMSEICIMGMVQEVLYKCRLLGEAIQGSAHSIRDRLVSLMLDLYFTRRRGLPEPDWRNDEQQILSTFTPSPEITSTAYNAYASGTSLFQEGNFKEAREYFSKAASDIRFGKTARKYIFLTFLPKGLGLAVQRLFSYKADKWKAYRIPPRLWPYIDKGFY